MSSQSNEETLNFIQDYESYNVLWNFRDKNYLNKHMRRDALKELSKKYSLSIDGVKNKIKSLRSYFAKEHRKTIEKKTGPGADDDYVSGWFAYKAMLFIIDAISPTDTKESSLENSNPQTCNENSFTTNQPTFDNDLVIDEHFLLPKHFVKKRKYTSVPTVDAGTKLVDAYDFMKKANDALTCKDESAVYGEMIAIKLRKLTPINRAIAQNRISNLIFELEMEELQVATPISSPMGSTSSP